MKRFSLILLVLVLLLTGCDKKLNRLRQKNLNGITIGVLASSMQEKRVCDEWPDGQIRAYETNQEVLEALKANEVDCAYLDELVIYNEVYDKKQIEFAFVDNDRMPIAGAICKDDSLLADEFDRFLWKIKSNCEYVRLKNRWTMTNNIDSIKPRPVRPRQFDRPTLRVGIVGEMRPYSVKLKGQWSGFENELWDLFAEKTNRNIEYIVYDFDNLIPALLSKKIDVIAGAMTITEERERQVLFTTPYSYSCSACFINKKPRRNHKE